MPINCNITSLEELREKRSEWKHEAMKEFIGDATSYEKSIEGFKVRIRWDRGSKKIKNKENAEGAAQTGKNRVTKWATEKFGAKFSNWVSVDPANADWVSARIEFPPLLFDAYLVKLGLKSLDEIRDKSKEFLDFVNDDDILSEDDYLEYQEAIDEERKKDLLFNLAAVQQSPEISYQTPAQQETINKLKEAMASLGATIETTNSILEEFGANAVIDLSSKLIQIAEGKENVALTEEAMHLITALLPKQMLEDLMSQITSYNIYKDTYNQYSKHPSYQKNGKVNVEKMKFEAIGKLLAEFYIAKAEDLSKEEINAAKTLWGSILDWIKNVFGKTKTSFQSIINQLEDGTLALSTQPTTRGMFYQIAFDKAKPSDIAEILSKGLDRTDITKENKDENAQKLFKLKTQIENIKLKDLPLIHSSKKNIHLSSKEPFSEASRKIENALTAKDLKESALNAINYFMSINGVLKNLDIRSKELYKEISSGMEEQSIDGEKTMIPLTREKKLYNGLEIAKIDRIAEIYMEELKTFKEIWIDDDISEFKETIDKISKSAENIIAYNKRGHIQGLRELLSKAINPKTEKYIENQKRKRTEIQLAIPKLKGKEKAIKENELSEIENNIKNPPFSVDKAMQMVTEEMHPKLLSKVQTLISKYFEGGQTHYDDLIQAIVNVLEDTNRNSKKESDEATSKLKQLFDKYKLKFGIAGKTYDKYQKKVKRFSFNKTNNILEEYEEYVLVNDVEQWRFDNMMETLSYLRYNIDKEVPFSHLQEVYKKVFDEDLPFSDDMELTLKELQRDLYSYGQDQYTEEYRNIQALLDVPLTATKIDEDGREVNKTVRDVRKEYTDALRSAQNDVDNAVGEYATGEAQDEVDKALDALRTLSSIYHKGIKKTGDDLIVAETISKWMAAKKFKNNKIADVDISFITNDRKAEWLEKKQRIDASNNEEEKRLWYRINVISEPKKEYTKQVEDIYTRIGNILERNGRGDERLDDLREDRTQLTRGYRDEDGIIDGRAFDDEHARKIRDIEKQINYIKQEAKAANSRMPKEDRLALAALFKKLDSIQDSGLTKYWNERFHEANMLISGALSVQEQDKALQESDFIKINTIDVTDEYRESQVAPPDNIVRIGNRFYAPTYIWRQTSPKPEWIDDEQPSFRWKTHDVHKDFKNDDYETNQGNVALNKSDKTKARFKSDEYLKLSDEDKQFVKELRDYHLELQEQRPKYERLYESLPRVQAEGFQRIKQRVTNAKYATTNLLTAAYWKNIIDLNPTMLETEYGEGSTNDNKGLSVRTKMQSKEFAAQRQNKDLFEVMSLYTLDTKRVKNMRLILPALNTLLNMLPEEKKSTRTFSLEREIQKRVNKVNKRDTDIIKPLAQLQSTVQGFLSFVRIGLPNITQVVKNTTNGLWAVKVHNSYLNQYSKESISKAIFSAIKSAAAVTGQVFSSHPSKEMAIIRRLNVVGSVDSYGAVKNQKDILLKTVDAIGYTLSGAKTFSEVHLELIMFELLKQKYKTLTGKELYDEYTYINGELKAVGITPEKEDEITHESRDMYNFVHGNFRMDNQPIAKMYFLGRMVSFMKSFVYDPAIKRYGKKRISSEGVEIEGFYRVAINLIKQNPRNIMHALSSNPALTSEQKGAIWSFYKDFIAINAMGVALHIIAGMLKESGDDDKEEWAKWYALMLARKTYSEMSFYNPAEYVGKPIDQLFLKDKQPGKRVKNFFTYELQNPAFSLFLESFVPVNWQTFALSNDEILHEKDPFYKNFKDNWILYDVMKTANASPNILNPQRALNTWEIYDRSIYQYDKSKKK